MKSLQYPYLVKGESKGKMLYPLALVVFIAILVFNGTFFRVRPIEELPTIDWLTLIQVITCLLGFVIGFILILKSNARFGFGSIVLLLFLTATVISAFASPYHTIVIGYVVLLLGASVLVFGLVQSASDVKSLELIERVWFFTVAACVIKDAITSFIFPDPKVGEEAIRLGMNTTHANQISLLATLVFWLSFQQKKSNVIIWILRVAMVLVLFGAIGRIAILAFLFGGFFYFFLKTRGYIKRWIFTLVCLSSIFLALLLFSFSPRLSAPLAFYAKRGQTQSEIVAFTGRVFIWKQALKQIPESPIIGHGYGVTRFALQPFSWNYQPTHCHNEFLEALFSMGFLGLIPLVFMYIYNLKWIKTFSRLREIFSTDLALHASCAVIILLISAFFEVRISVRLLQYQPLFFFYLLMLDREKQFVIMKERILHQPDRE